ncbi:hypothetical protein [uncultured Roseobacter sp.]|uniref:hypothetical protein n=1 Tax=uncultured Roseobacter sp. TaxID=114847 RepID=UPI00260F07EB|nr:hypothetical protein [uncultured Roseobacter sp.]
MADYKFWLPMAAAVGVGIFAFTLQNRVAGLEQQLASERALRADLQTVLDAQGEKLAATETFAMQGDKALSDKIDNLTHPVEIADTLLSGDRKAELLDAMWTEHGGSLAGSTALAAQVAQIVASEYGGELTGSIETVKATDIAAVLARSEVFAQLVASLSEEGN